MIQINFDLALKGKVSLGEIGSHETDFDEVVKIEVRYQPTTKFIKGKKIATVLCDTSSKLWKLCRMQFSW